MNFEEVKKYLPKYLSDEETKALYQEIKSFPDNIDKRFYSSQDFSNEVLQGDGITKLPVVHLPNAKIGSGPVLVLSNSCDNAPENDRLNQLSVIYCPLVKLSRYRKSLIENGADNDTLENHVDNIKRQYNTSIFYLPSGGALKEEYLALMDKAISCAPKVVLDEKDNNGKLFSLSDYGFYLFLVKLSIHFTRVRESVRRSKLEDLPV